MGDISQVLSSCGVPEGGWLVGDLDLPLSRMSFPPLPPSVGTHLQCDCSAHIQGESVG